MDPTLANEIPEYAALRQIYDGLLAFNADYTGLAPALATSWSSNAEATEWVFNLRPNVKFHDGTPLTSSAVRQSMLYYVKNGDGAYFGSLKTIDDSDPLVLKVTLSEPFPDLALNQVYPKVISPQLLAQKNAVASRAVGTGAFQWVSWQNNEIKLAANPTYWGRPEPYVDTVTLQVVGNETARVDALISGGLDIIEEVDPHDLALLLSSPKLALSSAPIWTEICVQFVCNAKPTNDVRVRQAFAYGIDREAIVRDALLGQGTIALSPIPVGCYGYAVPDVGYEYSPAKARQLLKEAGYPKGISLTMAGSSDLATEGIMGEAMVGQLAESGINLSFVVDELGVMVTDQLSVHPKHDMFVVHYGWVNGGPWHFDIPDVLEYSKYNLAHPNSALAAALHKSSATPNGPTRTLYLKQAQDLFMEQLPHLPIYNPIITDAYNSKIQDYRVPNDGQLLLTGAYWK
jgi:peptide/nickel transport system substrate-binding protein